MEHGLYEYDMEEHLDEWYAGLIADGEELVFVLTENSGHVAMVLIMKDRTVYVNEDAREKLSQLWVVAYAQNMKLLIPQMAEDIDRGFFSVNGVVVTNKSPQKLGISKGFG